MTDKPASPRQAERYGAPHRISRRTKIVATPGPASDSDRCRRPDLVVISFVSHSADIHHAQALLDRHGLSVAITVSPGWNQPDENSALGIGAL